MAIRMTGLNSGLNTESIVAALMSAQRTKQTKIENKKTKLEWKQEVWSSLNTKIYDFYKGSLAKIRMQSNYRTKAATSSNTSKVTATASTSAATGNYAIQVKHIASAQSVTGGKIQGVSVKDEDGNDTIAKATSNSKLVDLVGPNGEKKFTNNTQIRITTGEEGNTKTTYLDVDDNTTIQNFVDKLKNAGLNASFDEQQGRFFISSNKSGAKNKFTISSVELEGSDTDPSTQKGVSNKLKELIGYNGLSSANKTKADNIMAGLQSGKKNVDEVIEELTTLANNKTEKDAKQRATEFYTILAKQNATKKLDEDIVGTGATKEPTYEQYADFLNKNGYKINAETDYKSRVKYEEAVNAAKDKYIEKQTKELLKTDEYKNYISNSIENGIDIGEMSKLDSYVNAHEISDFVFKSSDNDTTKNERATNFYTAVAKNEASKPLEKLSTYEQYAEFLNKNGYIIKSENEYENSEKYKEAINTAKNEYIEKKTGELLNTDDYKNKITEAKNNGLTEDEVERAGLKLKNDFVFKNHIDRTLDTNASIETVAKKYVEEMQKVNYDSGTGDALKSLGLDNITVDKDGNFTVAGKIVDADKGDNITADKDTDMAVVTAKDTKIIYNGAVMTSDTTNISVGGLELNLLSETADNETVNISVTNDTSAIYDTIKDFITEYNSVLTEMNKYYGADSAKGYDILTDEEKDAMSESEVEKWETKIKDSLLRRDTTLSGIVSSFRNNMMGMVTASNGKRYALSSLGISTSADYAEGGLLHIKGDEDDSEYADDENVLKKMLEEDPDTVTQVLTKLGDNLYQDLQKKMSFTKMSSAFTFYNDKEMASQLSDYKKDISTWQDKLNEIEDRYYKQFTAMEKALANLQSQQNSLANLLGS